ncbi:uncharacterized protein LOC128998400 [Macrosteles quadrilineatus]|uniref:uncharacterized protein LOC128998400 n=1 Tax=Macrosteles quadrilineatus TaxID=74068 RepID=UPI0023E310F2|nr:uncharacterized protein LOC128998400 [Macrosteles quadrilineatus]
MDLSSLILSLVVISRVSSESDEDLDYQDSCLPQLADRCFKGLMTSLTCEIESLNHCSQFGDFCSIATESLQCASDIIDSDCQKGRSNFDSWLKGLQAAKERVCENNAALLRALTATPCFNIEEFLECVEDKTRVTHVLDLLQVSLNKDECNLLLTALPTCNVRAHAAHSQCHPPQDAINAIVLAFFSNTECGQCHPRSGLLVSGSHGLLSEGSFSLLLFSSALYLKFYY